MKCIGHLVVVLAVAMAAACLHCPESLAQGLAQSELAVEGDALWGSGKIETAGKQASQTWSGLVDTLKSGTVVNVEQRMQLLKGTQIQAVGARTLKVRFVPTEGEFQVSGIVVGTTAPVSGSSLYANVPNAEELKELVLDVRNMRLSPLGAADVQNLPQPLALQVAVEWADAAPPPWVIRAVSLRWLWGVGGSLTALAPVTVQTRTGAGF